MSRAQIENIEEYLLYGFDGRIVGVLFPGEERALVFEEVPLPENVEKEIKEYLSEKGFTAEFVYLSNIFIPEPSAGVDYIYLLGKGKDNRAVLGITFRESHNSDRVATDPDGAVELAEGNFDLRAPDGTTLLDAILITFGEIPPNNYDIWRFNREAGVVLISKSIEHERNIEEILDNAAEIIEKTTGKKILGFISEDGGDMNLYRPYFQSRKRRGDVKR